MDIEYDMMRSARDRQFLYIRNFAPELPYAGHIIYRNQSAIMQEWLRLQAERRAHRPGRAVDADAAGPPRSCTTRTPIRIRSAISPPTRRIATTLERMRKAVTDWMTRIDDQGLVNEPEMIQRMWPGGVQPETAQPYIVPRRELDAPSRAGAMAITAPTEVVIYVPTQGASIGYTTEDGPDGEVAALHRPDPVRRADDASRQGDPLRLQGKRGDAHRVYARLEPHPHQH